MRATNWMELIHNPIKYYRNISKHVVVMSRTISTHKDSFRGGNCPKKKVTHQSCTQHAYLTRLSSLLSTSAIFPSIYALRTTNK